jgi:glycosyltransferase involved in cell wall biosynthesis
VGSITVDEIFTPTKDSFPFKSRKLSSVGHGIDTKKFSQVIDERVERSGIVSLGRVSEVKRLDRLIAGAYESEVEGIEVTLIGPRSEKSDLYKSLVSLGERRGVSVTFLGAVPHTQVPEKISQFSMCYTGSPKTVDKSSIEGALMGCFVLAENFNVLEQTGMNEVWKIIGQSAPATIAEQIRVLSNFESRIDLREILRQSAIQKNNLNSTARKIYDILNKND